MTITAWSNVAIVRKGQEPTRGDEVLTGAWQMKLARLEWKSEKHLQITLPVNADIYRQEADLRGITVEVKFNPDDPKAREEFLLEHENFLREQAERLARIKSP